MFLTRCLVNLPCEGSSQNVCFCYGVPTHLQPKQIFHLVPIFVLHCTNVTVYDSFIHLLPSLHGSCLKGTGKGAIGDWSLRLCNSVMSRLLTSQVISLTRRKEWYTCILYIYTSRLVTRFSRRETLSSKVSRIRRIEMRVTVNLLLSDTVTHFFSHDMRKSDTHVYISFFKPLIRQKRLGHRSNTMVK